MLTIACVLRSGGDFRAEHVAALRDGVARHLAAAHRFVCLSDMDVDCERIALRGRWPGWWSKTEALLLPGPTLFFDLDVEIVSDLAPLAEVAMREPFVMLRDFYRPNGLQSAVMAWSGDMAWLHEAFIASPLRWMTECGKGGDQQFIERNVRTSDVARWQDVLLGNLVSFKADVRPNGGIPCGASMVVFHGQPRPWDLPAHERTWFEERVPECALS